jgi:hypothetical protein
MSILANAISTTVPVDVQFNLLREAPVQSLDYGLLDFARDLDAERRRQDQQALEAARQTLAQEASES